MQSYMRAALIPYVTPSVLSSEIVPVCVIGLFGFVYLVG